VKELLSRTLKAGLPPNVIVLMHQGKPLKDSLSLAYYNIPSKANFEFSLK
jgi:hypothetical protein